MGRFNTFLKGAPIQDPPLPMCHTTSWLRFADIEAKNLLEPQQTKDGAFPGETLLCFYYGRPAYKLSVLPTAKSTTDRELLPVCFVVDTSKMPSLARVAPFDTGAFANHLYEAVINPEFGLEDFLLDPQPHMAQRIVGYYYGSNRRYVFSEPAEKRVPVNQPEASAYYNLIHSRGAAVDFDDRSSTIELQSHDAFPLASGSVLKIVVPGFVLDELNYVEALVSRWSVEIEAYGFYGVHHPAFYTALIYERVVDFLERRYLS